MNRYVIIVAIGAFVTRVAAYYLKLPNLKFRGELETKKILEVPGEKS